MAGWLLLEKEMIKGTLSEKMGKMQTSNNVAGVDTVKTWTSLFLEEALRATEVRTVWGKIVRVAANPQTLEEG